MTAQTSASALMSRLPSRVTRWVDTGRWSSGCGTRSCTGPSVPFHPSAALLMSLGARKVRPADCAPVLATLTDGTFALGSTTLLQHLRFCCSLQRLPGRGQGGMEAVRCNRARSEVRIPQRLTNPHRCGDGRQGPRFTAAAGEVPNGSPVKQSRGAVRCCMNAQLVLQRLMPVCDCR